jgi:hypothetical protein
MYDGKMARLYFLYYSYIEIHGIIVNKERKSFLVVFDLKNYILDVILREAYKCEFAREPHF